MSHLNDVLTASKILEEYPQINGPFGFPLETMSNIVFVMKVTKNLTVQDFYNNVIKYLQDRTKKDLHNKPKTETIEAEECFIDISFYFEQYVEYLKTFKKLIEKEIFPKYPEDAFDIMYYYHEIERTPEEYIRINENGNIEISGLKII